MRKVAFLVVLSLQVVLGYGTHIRGGQITISQVTGLRCEITLTEYINTGSPISFGGGTLNFGDGTMVTLPTSPSEPTMYVEVGIVKFNILHDYAVPGFYVVSYLEHNLNAGILNYFNSVETPLVLESGFTLDPLLENYSFPSFNIIPNFRAPLGRTYTFSTAIVEPTHWYSYQLVSAGPGYVLPDSISINPNNGLVTWDTRFEGTYQAGEFFFLAHITQFDNAGNYRGFVKRAFQVILEETSSRIAILNPIQDPDGRIVIPENEQKTFEVILEDSLSADSLWWGLDVDPSLTDAISIQTSDSVSASRRMKLAWVTLRTTPTIVRDLPYVFSLRGMSDNYLFSRDVNFLFFTKDTPLPFVTGLMHPPDKSISVFPNPFSDFLFLNGLGDQGGSANILNSMGQTMLQIRLDPGQAVDATSLPPGVYLIQINNGSHTTEVKAIKK